MNGSSRINDQNSKAELAAQFNKFYLQITSATINQIGNYQIIEEIGEGAFGKVYLANHVLLKVKVVLKCGLVDDPNIVREIYYHKQLRHKNIVKLYEVIKTEKHLWMALEYCEGNDLFYHIYDKRRLGYEECQRLFYQILMGVRYVHSLNLAHRDLKLENILLADRKKIIVKLTDFGFVREFKRQFLSTICGTTVYMAPEMLKNEKYSGFAVDIWSLGVILYTMLYGEMPFDEDDDLRTKYKIVNEEPIYRDTIPQEAINLLKKMLSKDPNLRPSLNEILNSSFLAKIHDKKVYRRSDNESIISINQLYSSNTLPFQSKIEKELLKRFAKLNINTEQLQIDVNNYERNSLTAFYELSLTREYSKKKQRYYKEKRRKYYEAKESLKKSKKRVKGVLSLTDQNSQPLERIISSLSLSSNRTSVKVANTKQNESNLVPQTSSNGPPLQRMVSFFTEENMRRPSDATAVATSNSDNSKKRSKNTKVLNKLQFWKRKKNDDLEPAFNLEPNESLEKAKYSTDYSIDDGPLGINVQRTTPTPKVDPEVAEQLNLEKPMDNLAVRPMRPRPSSMVSQMSQNSHISQLSTMLSESELDILDETDTMDEEYDEDIYESSLNTSQDRNSSTGMTPASSTMQKMKNTSSYRRNLSSDVSIISSSTTATGKHQKKLSLSQLSSNSSDESLLKSNGIASPIPTQPIISETNPLLLGNGRSSSPDLATNKKIWKQTITNNPSPLIGPQARSHSPPIPKKFNKMNSKFVRPVKTVFGNNHAWKMNENFRETSQIDETWNSNSNNTSKAGNSLYGPVINEEEEGDY